MLQLWKSMVIPHLDYCSQLWNPHLTKSDQKVRRTTEILHKTHQWLSQKVILAITQRTWPLLTAEEKRKIPDHLPLVNPGRPGAKHPVQRNQLDQDSIRCQFPSWQNHTDKTTEKHKILQPQIQFSAIPWGKTVQQTSKKMCAISQASQKMTFKNSLDSLDSLSYK